MKIAIVHDDLVQWGGAERMLLGLAEAFPDAPIYTSVFDHSNKLIIEKFEEKRIITSFMQKIPFWRKLYKVLFPVYPIAFEQFDFSEFDVVISQTTRFAKSIITKPETVHICYMHTPPRFLYQFTDEPLSFLLRPLLSYFRMFDQIAAERPDLYLAGSKNAQRRIKNIYNHESEVLYPFVEVENYDMSSSFDGGYYLIISRLNKYKHVDVVVKTCAILGVPLKVVGRGPELANLKSLAGKNVEFFSGVPDTLLRNLISGCKGLIVAAEEDFGLTPLEAQAMGKPVIAFGRGGALETVVDGKTGVFFENVSVAALKEAISRFEKLTFDPKNCRENAEKFAKKHFIAKVRSFVEKSVKTL